VPKPFETTKPIEQPVAGIGDNSRNATLEEMARGDFNDAIDQVQGLRRRITDLIGAAERASCTSDNELARCAETIRQMRACEAHVEDARKGVKQPYLEAGRAIDEMAKTIVIELSPAHAKVRKMSEDYLREQEALRRKREAEAAARQREAEQARIAELAKAAEENREPEAHVYVPAAREAVPERVSVRSDFGALATSAKKKVAVVNDYAKAFKAVKTVPAVQEAIQKAVQKLVNAGHTEIPGVTIEDDVSLRIR